MEGWLRENEGRDDAKGLDVDEACDALSKQMLDCMASDMAVEVAIYALDKAAQEGAVPFDVYMRNVRLLSREQFFHRAIGSKLRAVRTQSMASMAQQYAFP
ncbi:Protein ELC [Salvia divinorum]